MNVSRENLKHLATLGTAVAAIVAAIVSYQRETKDSRTEPAYDLLSTKIEELQKESRKQHDDLVSLRAYLDGYLHRVRSSQEKILQERPPAPEKPPRPAPTASSAPDPSLLPPEPKLPRPAAPAPLQAPPQIGAVAQ